MTTPVRISIAGTVALVVALVAWSVGGENVDDADRRRQIAMKSETERELLRRRYEDFQKLPPEEREAIREIHEAIEHDQELAQTLTLYQSFVQRLEPWDQQELRTIEEAPQRIAKVRQLIAERSPPEMPGRPSWLSGRGSDRFTFAPHRFGEAMDLVADLLDPSQTVRKEWEALPSHKRHLEIAERFAERFRKQPRWPDQPDYERIVRLMPDDGFREALLREETPAEVARRLLAYTLMKSLQAEWQRQIPHHVPHGTIRQVLDDMSDREQAEMTGQDPDRLMHKVMQILAQSDDDIGGFAKDFVTVNELRSEFDPRRGGFRWPRPDDRGERGRPGPPRGRGGPGEGPPRDSRFDEGRSGFDRFQGQGPGGPPRSGDPRDRDKKRD